MSTPTNRIVVTAAVAAALSGGLFAQPELVSTSPEERLRLQIADLQTETGLARPAGLVDPLRTLATLYQETDDHALAIVALEEARYVTRVHQGLVSADEALLLRQQIRSEKVLGNDQRVWDLEQDMVTIARQNHDDIRMVPVFRELAEDRSAALGEYRAGGFPPEIELGCYYVSGLRRYDDTRGEHRPAENEGDCGSGQSASVTRRLRAETLIYYGDAIEVILESGDYASQELRDLERQAFRTMTFPGVADIVLQKTGDWVPVSVSIRPPSAAVSPCSRARAEPEALDQLLASEILGSCLAPLVHANGIVEANVGGWASLVRLIAYEIRSGAPAPVRAKAFVELADWGLAFTPTGRRRFDERATIELYERAYRELQQDDEARAAMFSPEVPITFAPNPFASTAAAESSPYIDASFQITKYGRSARIEIVQRSIDVTRADERDLIRMIESTSFRPRFVDGKLADSAPVVVRYPFRR